jgi:hypothetical protein
MSNQVGPLVAAIPTVIVAKMPIGQISALKMSERDNVALICSRSEEISCKKAVIYSSPSAGQALAFSSADASARSLLPRSRPP